MKIFESDKVEFKSSHTADIKKEIVAFANTYGGTIYIGISDNWEILGVNNPNFVMEQVSNYIRDSIKPDITMCVHIQNMIKENKNIIVITVQQGTKKPYYIVQKGLKPSGVYVRSASTSAPAPEELTRQMIKLTDGESFEKNRSLYQELTFDSIKKEMYRRGMEFLR